jgi:hypothetical protein
VRGEGRQPLSPPSAGETRSAILRPESQLTRFDQHYTVRQDLSLTARCHSRPLIAKAPSVWLLGAKEKSARHRCSQGLLYGVLAAELRRRPGYRAQTVPPPSPASAVMSAAPGP